MSGGKIGLQIAPDHPAFAGHFPDRPIVPGVVLLDEALHAVGGEIGKDLSACRIGAAKFLSPAQPGDPLEVHYEQLENGTVQLVILSQERKIATASVRPGDCVR